MPDQFDSDVCPICRMPKRGSQVPTLTQWISLCRCNAAVPEAENMEGVMPPGICLDCGKRIDQGRVGTLTQFIFRADLCQCRKNDLSHQPASRQNEPEIEVDSKVEKTGDETGLADLPEISVDRRQFPVDRYKPLQLLGQGSAGLVYKCFDRLLEKPVAVKSLSFLSAPQVVAFQNEARITSQLDHPGIVKILDFGVTAHGSPYMVLEFIEGQNLEQYLRDHGRLEPVMACHVIATACDALQYAHTSGVFHRDLKPSNLLLVETSAGMPVLKIIDFGIAKIRRQQDGLSDSSLALVGTPGYMAPEQFRGAAIDARSEVYSLGCVLFETLCGQQLFKSESALSALMKQADDSPSLLTDIAPDANIPAPLQAVVAKCLEKDPGARYSSMEELASALDSAALSLQSGHSLEPNEPPVTRTITRFAMIALLATPLLIGIISAGFMFGTKYSAEPARRTNKSGKELNAKGPILFLPDVREAEERSKLDVHRNPSSVSYSGQILTETVFVNLEKMSNLGDLRLTESTIQDDWLEHLERLHLWRLTLGETPLSDRGLRHVSKITSLKVLDIHATNVTDSGLALLDNLRLLDVLDVSATKVTDKSTSTILQFKDLTRLQIADTQITGAGLAALAQLKHLAFLDLEGTRLSSAERASLEHMKGLRTLSLMRCELNDRDLDMVSRIEQLRTLNLNRNAAITGAGVLKLSKLKNLEELDLFDCPAIAPQAIERLSKELPRCRISRDPRAPAGTSTEMYYPLGN